nr:GNAT family N-acetyltransferase [Renibacterium salmoninarum]
MRVLVSESDGGKLIGFAGLDEAKLEMLFVDPNAHNQGIGRSLVERTVAELGPLTVDVNEQNPRACGFYERMGFVSTGRSETDAEGNPYPILHMAQA